MTCPLSFKIWKCSKISNMLPAKKAWQTVQTQIMVFLALFLQCGCHCKLFLGPFCRAHIIWHNALVWAHTSRLRSLSPQVTWSISQPLLWLAFWGLQAGFHRQPLTYLRHLKGCETHHHHKKQNDQGLPCSFFVNWEQRVKSVQNV